MPVNWSAYEDIAEFFSVHVKEIDGVRVYGHMDYGKRAPDLGWRMTDAWLSMAGAGSKGIPNGRPIDEWGIRMEEGLLQSGRRLGHPRRRDQRSRLRLRDPQVGRVAAQVCASGCGRLRLLPVAAGALAGQRRPADLLVHGLHGRDGEAQERRATTPSTTRAIRCGAWRRRRTAPYWEDGMKLGYQDAGSWTLFKSTPVDRRKAAWLYAQFMVSKTVSLKKSHVGLTIIRDSDIRHQVVHRPRAQARRPGRVLPLAGPRALDADRRQRARLSEAGAALVAATSAT